MGSDFEQFPDAKPIHKVYVDGFWMDKTEVTNAQFAKFVAGHWLCDGGGTPAGSRKTFLALMPTAFGFQSDYVAILAAAPGQGVAGTLPWAGLYHAPGGLKPFSLVFHMPEKAVQPKDANPSTWWRAVAGPPGCTRKGLAAI